MWDSLISYFLFWSIRCSTRDWSLKSDYLFQNYHYHDILYIKSADNDNLEIHARILPVSIFPAAPVDVRRDTDWMWIFRLSRRIVFDDLFEFSLFILLHTLWEFYANATTKSRPELLAGEMSDDDEENNFICVAYFLFHHINISNIYENRIHDIESYTLRQCNISQCSFKHHSMIFTVNKI